MEALLILSKEYTVAFTYLQIDVYLDIYVQFVENQCVKKKKIKRKGVCHLTLVNHLSSDGRSTL